MISFCLQIVAKRLGLNGCKEQEPYGYLYKNKKCIEMVNLLVSIFTKLSLCKIPKNIEGNRMYLFLDTFISMYMTTNFTEKYLQVLNEQEL